MKKLRMKAGDRKDQILDVAIRIIARTNFEKATSAVISKEIGITEPLIYNYFKTKKELQLAVFTFIQKKLLLRIKRFEEVEIPSLSNFRIIGKEQQKKIRKKPDYIKVMLKGLAMEDKEIKERAWEIIKSLQTTIQSIFDKGIKQGNMISGPDTEIVAWILVAWISLLSITSALGKSDEMNEEKIDRFAELIDAWIIPADTS